MSFALKFTFIIAHCTCVHNPFIFYISFLKFSSKNEKKRKKERLKNNCKTKLNVKKNWMNFFPLPFFAEKSPEIAYNTLSFFQIIIIITTVKSRIDNNGGLKLHESGID